MTLRFLLASMFVASLLSSCSNSVKKVDPQAYAQEIQQWQQKRIKGLQSEDSWFSLAGLFWLKEGENKFGSNPANEIALPAGKTPDVAGSVFMENGKFRLVAKPGTGVKINDSLVTEATLQSDGEGLTDPTIVRMGPVSFYLIKRAEKMGVRVKDKESAGRLNFKGLDFFPVDLKWRFEAIFTPYNPVKIIPVATVINTVENDTCPGYLTFNVDGQECKLEPTVETGTTGKYFIMFADGTSGKETYGAGRQMYCDLPDANGKTILDFNKAYNWPCAYTSYATCPIPPAQNHLAVRIEAGEKNYPGGHSEVR